MSHFSTLEIIFTLRFLQYESNFVHQKSDLNYRDITSLNYRAFSKELL